MIWMISARNCRCEHVISVQESNPITNPRQAHPLTGEFPSRSLWGGEKVKLIQGFTDFAILDFIYCSIMNAASSGACWVGKWKGH
jgi:hypothetical protein